MADTKRFSFRICDSLGPFGGCWRLAVRPPVEYQTNRAEHQQERHTLDPGHRHAKKEREVAT